jgi:pilus assembly protein Flp/PilA
MHMLDYVRIRVRAMARTERGASAVEYGLLVALIAIAIIVAITFLGGSLDKIFNKTATEVNNAAT